MPLKFLRKQTSQLSNLIEPQKQSKYSFLGISYKINRDSDEIKSILLYDKMGKSYFIPKCKDRDLKLKLKLDRNGRLYIQDLNSSFLYNKSGSSSPESGITLTANNSGVKFSSSDSFIDDIDHIYGGDTHKYDPNQMDNGDAIKLSDINKTKW